MIYSVIDFLDNNIVRKTSVCDSLYSMEFMTALLNHFINSPHSMIVPISNFKKVKKLMYTYDMIKLNPLTPEEDSLIDLVGEMEFDYGRRACHLLEMKHPGVREVYPVLFPFLETIIAENKYWDIHSGNIMKLDNNYYIIDLEGFANEPLNDESNNWIIR